MKGSFFPLVCLVFLLGWSSGGTSLAEVEVEPTQPAPTEQSAEDASADVTSRGFFSDLQKRVSPKPSFPFNLELTKPLGFRQQPGLKAPHVLPNLNYLQPPTRVRVIGSTGPLWTPGTFCNVEYASKRGFIRCDDLSAVKILTAIPNKPIGTGASSAGQSGGGPIAAGYSVTKIGTTFCRDVESCKAFCSSACTLDLTKWRPVSDDGATTCPGAPTSGVGMIPENSLDLLHIPKLRFVSASKSVKATKETIEGLKRLDTYLTTSPSRAQYNYTVKVRNCYRPAIHDVEKECGFILKAMHILKKYPENEKLRKEWTPKLNPNNLGLAWPGATPHSAGNACDMILVDSKGKESFDWRVGAGSPRSSIDQRLASKMLDEAVTNDLVGGRRLNYEAWHYEWGTTLGCRCKDPECANKFWPPLGKPHCQ